MYVSEWLLIIVSCKNLWKALKHLHFQFQLPLLRSWGFVGGWHMTHTFHALDGLSSWPFISGLVLRGSIKLVGALESVPLCPQRSRASIPTRSRNPISKPPFRAQPCCSDKERRAEKKAAADNNSTNNSNRSDIHAVYMGPCGWRRHKVWTLRIVRCRCPSLAEIAILTDGCLRWIPDRQRSCDLDFSVATIVVTLALFVCGQQHNALMLQRIGYNAGPLWCIKCLDTCIHVYQEILRRHCTSK